MGTSVFLSCQISDEINDSLKLLRGELREYQKQHSEALDAVAPVVERILNGTDTYASAVVGTAATDQVTWTAKVVGRAGNAITVMYLYLGPEVDDTVSPPVLQARLPSAYTEGNAVTCVLAVDANGVVDPAYDVAASLPVWLSNSSVADLVGGELVGDGSGLPVSTGPVSLSGGSSASMKNTETAANEVAKIFGKNDYNELLESVNIPVVQNASDAKKYLNDTDDRYVIINGKLLLVEGTNLIGINKMYEATGNDLDEVKKILAEMQETPESPFLLISENETRERVEYVCGKPQKFTTVETEYRGYNMNIWDVANQYARGDANALNLFVFWPEAPSVTQKNDKSLLNWSIPDDYRGDILVGATPERSDRQVFVPPPEVLLVDQPDLLTQLGFTDAEIIELIETDIDGVAIPRNISITARVEAIRNLSKVNEATLDNGLSSGVDKTVSSAQAVDLGDTLDDDGLVRELATRGSACARQDKNFVNDLIPDPNFDQINVPTPDLPDAAKQVEAAFGALSSAVNVGNKIFDTQWNATVGMFGPLLNKIQNISSLSDNVFQNKLADCMLGTGEKPVGIPEVPELGSGQSPGISIPDVTGGLPIPTSLLKDALGDLSTDLDESLTDSVETIMKLLRTPMCIVQTMLSAINGFKPPTLGDVTDALNPCKAGADTEDNCPAEETQDIINASETMTSSLDSIDRLTDLPTEAVTEEIEETVQHFTGAVEKTTTEVQNEIERGVKQVMDDIQSSLDSKMEQIDNLREAINKLFGETSEQAQSAEENQKESSGCGSTTVGSFTDAIEGFIGG